MKNESSKLNIIKYEKPIKKRKRTRLKPWAFWTLVIIFVGIIISSIYVLYNWDKDNKEIITLEEELQTLIEPEIVEEEGTLINPPEEVESDYWYYIKEPFYSVNFNKLLEKNSDTIAFINVKNTNVNYPIVQTTDNDYYLTHAFDKTKNSAGWVYADFRNNSEFTDDNTIIYGHGRLNNTVFGSLRFVLEEEWQNNKDNYTISISTPSKDLVYQIFSIYTIPKESYYITPSFATAEKKLEWINTMKSRNIAPIDVEINESDYFLTLSTCLDSNGGRIVVHAKLIKEQTK